jgi:hypothetical protein
MSEPERPLRLLSLGQSGTENRNEFRPLTIFQMEVEFGASPAFTF